MISNNISDSEIGITLFPVKLFLLDFESISFLSYLIVKTLENQL